MKFLIIPMLILLIVGCSPIGPSKEVIDNNYYEIDSNDEFITVRAHFASIFNKELGYSDVAKGWLVSSPILYGVADYEERKIILSPTINTMNKCFKDNNIKIESYTYSQDYKRFVIKSSSDEIRSCIAAKINEPINERAITFLNYSELFNEYKNKQPLRNKINEYKADGVISIKEYADIIQTIDLLEDSRLQKEFDNLVKQL